MNKKSLIYQFVVIFLLFLSPLVAESTDGGLEFSGYDEGLETEGPAPEIMDNISGRLDSIKGGLASVGNWFKSINIKGLEVGTRITRYKLLEEDGDFIGSIDHLEGNQNYDPTRIFIDWYFYKKGDFNFGMELSWDRLAVNTITSSDGHNDSTIHISGPIISLIGRYENDSRFSPYAGIGLFIPDRTYTSKGWWHYGFDANPNWQAAEQAYVDWLNAGAPSWPNNGRERSFTLDASNGKTLTAGCEVLLSERTSLDLYFRYTDMNVHNQYDISYYGVAIKRTRKSEWEKDMDFSHYALGIGVKYRFS